MDGCQLREAPNHEALLDAVRERVGPQRYATWFDGAVGIRVEPSGVRVQAGSAFESELVRKRFDAELREAITHVLGSECRVTYGVDATRTAPSREPGAGRPPRQPKAPSPLTRRLEPSSPAAHPLEAAPPAADPLADWIESPSTAEATRVCRRVLAGDLTTSPALVWGSAGTGKTHLLRAISRAARARRKRTLLLTAEQFLVAFVEAIRGGGLTSFRHKHRGVEVFLLDNVQQLLGKEKTVEELQHTIDTLAADGALVVLSSDRGPAELSGLGPEIASRLSGGVTAELGPPDAAARAAMIRRAAAAHSRELPEGVVAHLAAGLLGGAREASGAVNRLLLLHEAYDAPLDEALAERVAADQNRVATPPVRIDDIQKAVCGVFGVEAGALRSKKRTKSCTEPRMLAMWLARKLTGSAWSEIGDHFGQRSHSTVISAHRRVETLLASDTPTRLSGSAGELRDAIRRVEAALRRA